MTRLAPILKALRGTTGSTRHLSEGNPGNPLLV
jgi:hypothetical protein